MNVEQWKSGEERDVSCREHSVELMRREGGAEEDEDNCKDGRGASKGED